MQVYFDVRELYYIPQYVPICSMLAARGVKCTFVFYEQGLFDDLLSGFGLEYQTCYVDGVDSAISVYQTEKTGWVIFGNKINGIERVQAFSKTALVSHGIGPKSCYYTVSDTPTSVRFVEGPYRLQRLKEMYPKQMFVDTGYAKLDPIINGEYDNLKPSSYGLDDTKKTVLYAPSFFPSSIEMFSKNFPDEFSDYNIILKPHYFSMSVEKYRKQRNMLEDWSKSKNVYLASQQDINLVPFMAVADVLISDASSALFEFSALDKPVVWCDFVKLRWTYRGPFRFRYHQRMDKDLYKYSDIAKHVDSYNSLRLAVDSQLEDPKEFSNIRQAHTMNLAGVVDGKASQRITNYILQNSSDK